MHKLVREEQTRSNRDRKKVIENGEWVAEIGREGAGIGLRVEEFLYEISIINIFGQWINILDMNGQFIKKLPSSWDWFYDDS